MVRTRVQSAGATHAFYCGFIVNSSGVFVGVGGPWGGGGRLTLNSIPGKHFLGVSWGGGRVFFSLRQLGREGLIFRLSRGHFFCHFPFDVSTKKCSKTHVGDPGPFWGHFREPV